MVARAARDLGSPRILFQVLIYPDLDFRRVNRSITEFAGKYGNVTRDAQHWLMNHYITDETDTVNPDVSPLLAEDLEGLPPAFIVTAEYDALRDEGEAYGARLALAGVAVEVKRYPGMIHEFMRQPFDDAQRAIDDVAAAVRGVLVD